MLTFISYDMSKFYANNLLFSLDRLEDNGCMHINITSKVCSYLYELTLFLHVLPIGRDVHVGLTYPE